MRNFLSGKELRIKIWSTCKHFQRGYFRVKYTKRFLRGNDMKIVHVENR